MTITIERGKVRFDRLNCGRLPDGTPVDLPVITVGGEKDGPTLLIQAAIHSRELIGIEVIRRITQEAVQPAELRGTIIGLPLANPYGFWARQDDPPQDPKNVNACFPGDPAGTVSERITHVIFTKVLPLCDYVLDFHTTPLHTGIEYTILPQVSRLDTLREAIRMSEFFGFPIVGVKHDRWGIDKSLVGMALEMGKPATLLEALATGVLWDPWIEHSMRGTLSVMKHLGMIDGEIVPPDDLPGKGKTVWLLDVSAPESGIARFWKTGGEWVEKGEAYGVIRDIYGREVCKVRSPARGIVRSFTTMGIVYAGQIITNILEPATPEELWGISLEE